MEPRQTLIAYSIKYGGDWNKIFKAMKAREEIEECYYQAADTLKCKTLTLLDSDYPDHLKQVYKPPIVLYYYGDLSLIRDYRKSISVVGSRNCSDYGVNMTKSIAGELAAMGYVIISGLARGIDSVAHQAAIESGGKTVAILGCGIDNCYPEENESLCDYLKENHLVISEYPGFTPPQAYHFPIRNRLIAGLSKTLVVTEASYNSGSLVTALLALRGNSDVMCVPHEAGKNSECNRLINNGAALVESAKDVIEQMSPF